MAICFLVKLRPSSVLVSVERCLLWNNVFDLIMLESEGDEKLELQLHSV